MPEMVARRQLFVDVVGARNLSSRKNIDTYCTVSLSSVIGGEKGDHGRSRSATVSTTSDPTWRHTVHLDVATKGDDCSLYIQVYSEKFFFFDMFPDAKDRSSSEVEEELPVDNVVQNAKSIHPPTMPSPTSSTSDELLSTLVISLPKLKQRSRPATDEWYLLPNCFTGEIRIRTAWMEAWQSFDDQATIEDLFQQNIYNVPMTDQFGFNVPEAAKTQWAHLRSYYDCREQRRIDQWEAAFPSATPEDLQANLSLVKKLARGGVPMHWRQRIYMHVSGAENKRKEVGETGSYHHLVQQCDAMDSSLFKQIELDIDRTFGHSGTRICSQDGRVMLRRILRAYSLRNPSIGYCQGLNFIVGFLLLLMDEEQTFWLLAVVCEDLVPGYYAPSMSETQTDLFVLKQLIAEDLPVLDTFTSEVEVPLELLGSQWLLCLFTTTFPSDTTFRIFDWLLTQGPSIIFPVIMAHLRLLEPVLIAQDDFQSVLAAIKNAENCMFDPDLLLSIALDEAKRMPACRIEELRQLGRESVQSELERAERARAFRSQLATVYQIPAFPSYAASLLRMFHQGAEGTSRSDVAFVLTLLCHGLVWLAEHSKHWKR